MERPVTFCGSALDDLRAFPDGPRQQAGFQIGRVQRGLDPDHWKPMASIGTGVREIIVRDAAGAFRVIYVAARREAVYVLHCFQKRSQKTSQADLALATRRLKELDR